MNLILTLTVVAASVLGSGMALPQAMRLARTGQVDGVSAVWIGVSMAINAWWTAYAVATELWAILPVSTVSLALYFAMATVYLRSVGRSALGGMAVGLLGLGMAPLPAFLIGGWDMAGLAILPLRPVHLDQKCSAHGPRAVSRYARGDAPLHRCHFCKVSVAVPQCAPGIPNAGEPWD